MARRKTTNAVADKLADVDGQRAAEEEEAKHPMEKSGVELHILHEGNGEGADIQGGVAQGDQDKGEEQGDQHYADAGVEVDVTIVEVAEEGGQRQQESDDVECVHRVRMLFDQCVGWNVWKVVSATGRTSITGDAPWCSVAGERKMHQRTPLGWGTAS